jgi:hypothetical protein
VTSVLKVLRTSQQLILQWFKFSSQSSILVCLRNSLCSPSMRTHVSEPKAPQMSKCFRGSQDATMDLIFEVPQNACHLQYSHSPRHAKSTRYRPTQIKTPLSSFCSSTLLEDCRFVLLGLGSRWRIAAYISVSVRSSIFQSGS